MLWLFTSYEMNKKMTNMDQKLFRKSLLQIVTAHFITNCFKKLLIATGTLLQNAVSSRSQETKRPASQTILLQVCLFSSWSPT